MMRPHRLPTCQGPCLTTARPHPSHVVFTHPCGTYGPIAKVPRFHPSVHHYRQSSQLGGSNSCNIINQLISQRKTLDSRVGLSGLESRQSSPLTVGPEVTSTIWAELCRLLNFRHAVTAAYYTLRRMECWNASITSSRISSITHVPRVPPYPDGGGGGDTGRWCQPAGQRPCSDDTTAPKQPRSRDRPPGLRHVRVELSTRLRG